MNTFQNFHKNIVIMVFDPIEGFYRIKRNKVSLIQGGVFILLALFTRIIQLYGTHYPLTTISIRDASLGLEFIKVLIPLFSWIIVSYGLSTIRNGESKLREVFTGTGFALIPFVFLTPIVTALSHILGVKEIGTYSTINAFIWIWVFILFFVQVRELNNYKVTETFIHIGLTIFGVLFVWVLLALGYLLSQNIVTFLRTIIFEIQMMMMG